MTRILIAEDEALIAFHLEFLLGRRGYDVLLCSNGRSALERIAGFPPDLILTDCMMPEMDGMELIARLRGMPRIRDVPIVLITAVPEAALAGRAADYDRYLQKPFQDAELLAVVEEVLARGGR
jgi:CheY-like chemotaxis protein